jgi:hypothetical protein
MHTVVHHEKVVGQGEGGDGGGGSGKEDMRLVCAWVA